MNEEPTAAPEQQQPVTTTAPAATAEAPKKKEPTAILLGKVHDITGFVSTDESRSVINGIHYDPEGGFVEATNGKVLIRVPITAPIDEFPPVADQSPAEECIIPLRPFQKALGNIPKNGSLAILRHMRVGTVQDKIIMTTSDLDTEQVVAARPIEGKFPNTEVVIPREEPKFSIALNPHVLEPIIEYAKKNRLSCGDAAAIKFLFTDSTSAVRFEIQIQDELFNDSKATGVLMPVRMK